MYLRTCSNSKPTVDTAYPRAQKCSPREIPLFATQAGHRYGALPFRNPITEATGYFGGIAIHLCTWSGSRCPSIIWVAVGMPIARHPPHRPVLACLAHTVPTLDTWRQSVWLANCYGRADFTGNRAAQVNWRWLSERIRQRNDRIRETLYNQHRNTG
jgi:hypothetical protein